MNTTLKWLGDHVSTVSIAGNEACCVNCKRFVQHYIKQSAMFGGGYVPILMGHCTFGNMKNRRAHQVCNYFEARDVQKGYTHDQRNQDQQP